MGYFKWGSRSGLYEFRNESEFASVVFRFGEGITYGLTPIMAYFIIYIALWNYTVKMIMIQFGVILNILPYSGYTILLWIIILIAFILLASF